MRVSKWITVVDTHTGGEPTRVWVNGPFNLPGETMRQRRDWFRTHYDHLRTFLMQEPRGHRGMCGAIITPPASPEADLGVIFMDNYHYMDMCGHATIGLVTALVEVGALHYVQGRNYLTLDTPAGLVKVVFSVTSAGVDEVAFRNVTSFHCAEETVRLPEYGEVKVDIAYGGNAFVLVDAEALHLKICPTNLPRLKLLASKILQAVNTQVEAYHPVTGDRIRPTWVQFYDEQDTPPRNVVIGGMLPPTDKSETITLCNKVDRSPCGTGLSAKLATLYKKGVLRVGDEYVYQSIIGSQFRGKIVAKDPPGIVPEISGRAYVTGINHLIATEEDIFKWGFLLPEG